jgi:hypothetical protein
MATGFDFSFGGHNWSYADFNLNEESLLCAISFVHSYENIERAKEQYEELVETLTQKYGRYNRNDESSVYWTDGTTSVGTRFEESSAINGNDRSFCYLYYVDNTLIEQVKDCRGRARGTTCSAQIGTGRGGQMGTARSAQ